MITARIWTTAAISDQDFRFNSEEEYLKKLDSMPVKNKFYEGDKVFVHMHIRFEDYNYGNGGWRQDAPFSFAQASAGKNYSGLNDISGYVDDNCPYWILSGLDCDFYLDGNYKAWNNFDYYGKNMPKQYWQLDRDYSGNDHIEYQKFSFTVERDFISEGAEVSRLQHGSLLSNPITIKDEQQISLIGGSRDETINGTGAAEVIDGRSGNDVLRGGGGADVFVLSGGTDIIKDFKIKVDSLRIPAGLKYNEPQNGGNKIILDHEYGRLTFEGINPSDWGVNVDVDSLKTADYNFDLTKISRDMPSAGKDITDIFLPSGIAESIIAPKRYKQKYVDKITNFNPSTDTLEIDADSFGIDSSATFAAGKNKKAVKKKLAQKDFDFLYDEKKGGLYFNENGADKGFGDGGIIAILKGAPELTANNLEFI